MKQEAPNILEIHHAKMTHKGLPDYMFMIPLDDPDTDELINEENYLKDLIKYSLESLSETDTAIFASVIAMMGLPFIAATPVVAGSVLVMLHDWYKSNPDEQRDLQAVAKRSRTAYLQLAKEYFSQYGLNMRHLSEFVEQQMPQQVDQVAEHGQDMQYKSVINRHTFSQDIFWKLLPNIILIIALVISNLNSRNQDPEDKDLINDGQIVDILEQMNWADYTYVDEQHAEVYGDTLFVPSSEYSSAGNIGDMAANDTQNNMWSFQQFGGNQPISLAPEGFGSRSFDNPAVRATLAYIGNTEGVLVNAPAGYLILGTANAYFGVNSTLNNLAIDDLTVIEGPVSEDIVAINSADDIVSEYALQIDYGIVTLNPYDSDNFRIARVFFDANLQEFFELTNVRVTDELGNELIGESVQIVSMEDGNYLISIFNTQASTLNISGIYTPVPEAMGNPLNPADNEFQIDDFEIDLSEAARQVYGDVNQDVTILVDAFRNNLDYSLLPYLDRSLADMPLDQFTARIIEEGLAMCSYGNIANLVLLESLESEGILDENDPANTLALAYGYLVFDGIAADLNAHMFAYDSQSIVDATPSNIVDPMDSITRSYLEALARLGASNRENTVADLTGENDNSNPAFDLQHGDANNTSINDEAMSELLNNRSTILGISVATLVLFGLAGLMLKNRGKVSRDVYDYLGAKGENEEKLITTAIYAIVYSKNKELLNNIELSATSLGQTKIQEGYMHVAKNHRALLLNLLSDFRSKELSN